MSHQPIALEKLKNLRKPVQNVWHEQRRHFHGLEKFAVWVTEHIGTMRFFVVLLCWTALWLGWNIFAPDAFRFDPYPAFVLWLFISNMMQLLFLPLIMVGQNLQGKYVEARAEAELEVNLKAEREIETILQHLENQNELVLKVLNRLENPEGK